MMHERTCVWCGRAFLADAHHPYAVYCTPRHGQLEERAISMLAYSSAVLWGSEWVAWEPERNVVGQVVGARSA